MSFHSQQMQAEATGNNDVRVCRHLSLPAEKSTWIQKRYCDVLPESKVIDHPVEVINRATKISLDGDYAMAINILSKTLKNIKLIISGDANVAMPTKPHSIDEGEGMNFDDCENDLHCPTISGSFEFDFDDSSPGSFFTTSLPIPGNDGAFRTVRIFAKPMIVKGDCFGKALDARICQALSCVTIYNLALFHQLQAISILKSSPYHVPTAIDYLDKALNLYEYSHEIFKSQKLPVKIPVLHCMALVCNLGQIHHLIGNHTTAQHCNEYLLSLWMYTVVGRKGEEDDSCMECGDHSLSGFLAIVEHLIISKENTAPAA